MPDYLLPDLVRAKPHPLYLKPDLSFADPVSSLLANGSEMATTACIGGDRVCLQRGLPADVCHQVDRQISFFPPRSAPDQVRELLCTVTLNSRHGLMEGAGCPRMD